MSKFFTENSLTSQNQSSFKPDYSCTNQPGLNHLLRAVPTCSALFKKRNTFFSTKTSENTCCFRGCSIEDALNLEKWGVKTHNCALLLDFLALFWLYHTHAFIFQNKPYQLQSITHQIYKSFNGGHGIRSVFLDISKTFDTVWYKSLFKLKQNGISGNLLSTLTDLLEPKKLVLQSQKEWC